MVLQIREGRMLQRLASTDALEFTQQVWQGELSC